MKLVAKSLVGSRIQLEPLTLDHLGPICEVAFLDDIFRWYPEPMRTPEAVRAYVERFMRLQREGLGIGFATILRETGKLVGGTACYATDIAHPRVEVGYSWIAPPWQRTGVNWEAKVLLLDYAFDELGCMRVEFKTDSYNEQSQRALERLGAKKEGVLRSHMKTSTGRMRDSVYYSIVKDEWPEVKERLCTSQRTFSKQTTTPPGG